MFVFSFLYTSLSKLNNLGKCWLLFTTKPAAAAVPPGLTNRSVEFFRKFPLDIILLL